MNRFSFVVWVMLFPAALSAQQHFNDPGNADTISLELVKPYTLGRNIPLALEVWVYSDEPILAFSAGFHWDNSNLHLDSAKPSSLLEGPGLMLFFYQSDDIDISNQNHTLVLGGLSFDSSKSRLDGNSYTRRLWATYYFTLNDWTSQDSLQIDTLSHSIVEYRFVRPGTVYSTSFRPQFGSPIRVGGSATGIEESLSNLPSDFTLRQNYPNPFNPETTIEFQLPRSSFTTLEVFNAIGQRVKCLLHERLQAGNHKVSWDSRLSDGSFAPSGVYMYRLVAGDLKQTRKMILLR